MVILTWSSCHLLRALFSLPWLCLMCSGMASDLSGFRPTATTPPTQYILILRIAVRSSWSKVSHGLTKREIPASRVVNAITAHEQGFVSSCSFNHPGHPSRGLSVIPRGVLFHSTELRHCYRLLRTGYGVSGDTNQCQSGSVWLPIA